MARFLGPQVAPSVIGLPIKPKVLIAPKTRQPLSVPLVCFFAMPSITMSKHMTSSALGVSVEMALKHLHAVGYSLLENLAFEDNQEAKEYDSGVSLSASNILDFQVPLDGLKGDIYNRHPDMLVPPVLPHDKPTAL
jgi:hypothetical protein